jgi:hypothetical protein
MSVTPEAPQATATIPATSVGTLLRTRHTQTSRQDSTGEEALGRQLIVASTVTTNFLARFIHCHLLDTTSPLALAPDCPRLHSRTTLTSSLQ